MTMPPDPDLSVAEAFYSAFGLEVRRAGGVLDCWPRERRSVR